MKIIKILLLIGITSFMTGCFEGRKTTEQLCNANPDLQCERFNIGDGQCRVPRTNLIWHRFDSRNEQTDINKIKDYELTFEYNKCLELASQIQSLTKEDVRRQRFNALVNSGEDLKSIVASLQQASSPQALYFLWTQAGSDSAKRAFLRLEGSPELETPEMQYALAMYYSGRDQEKTVELLLHSLELSRGQTVNSDIIQSLASTTHRMGRKEHAYIWTLVAAELEVPIASNNELQLLYGFDEDKFEQLQNIADDVLSALREGTFEPALLPAIE